MGRKAFSQEQFLDRIKSFGHNIEPLTQYINKRTKIRMRCNDCGYEWEVIPETLLKGSGCPECARKLNGEKHRLTHEQFIQNIPDFIEILDKYEKYGKPIRCRCKKCGYEWSNNPEYLLRNKHCPNCANTIRYTNESFKEKIKETCPNITVIGNYEEIQDKMNGNIQCKCNICGHIWYPNIVALKRGQNCPECNKKIQHNLNVKSKEQFIEDARKIHGNKYDYSKVEYINGKTKVCIICPEHGEFWQLPQAHISGKEGCPKCANEFRGKLLRRTNEDFIKIANSVHNNKYKYDKCMYTTKRNKVTITCPIHGDFEQTAGNHIRGTGCPKCKQSKGEILVQSLLNKYKISHIYQYTLNKTINNRKVVVDFVCKHNDIKYIIEYNGIQHYEPVEFFGGEEVFKLQKIRDNKLKEACKKSNIIFIEIPYYLSNEEIEKIIIEKFNIIL